MVCAILHKKHYDLGVVNTAQGIQAVFQVGEEWDNAIRLILRFIKAKLPPTGQAQCLICPRWKEKQQEGEVKLCVTVVPREQGALAHDTLPQVKEEAHSHAQARQKYTRRVTP